MSPEAKKIDVPDEFRCALCQDRHFQAGRAELVAAGHDTSGGDKLHRELHRIAWPAALHGGALPGWERDLMAARRHLADFAERLKVVKKGGQVAIARDLELTVEALEQKSIPRLAALVKAGEAVGVVDQVTRQRRDHTAEARLRDARVDLDRYQAAHLPAPPAMVEAHRAAVQEAVTARNEFDAGRARLNASGVEMQKLIEQAHATMAAGLVNVLREMGLEARKIVLPDLDVNLAYPRSPGLAGVDALCRLAERRAGMASALGRQDALCSFADACGEEVAEVLNARGHGLPAPRERKGRAA